MAYKFKFLFILLVITPFITYGKVIDTYKNQAFILNDKNDPEILITKAGAVDIETNAESLANNAGNKGRAITIQDNPQTIINYGNIISKVVEPYYQKGYFSVTSSRGYAIYIANGYVKDNSVINNYGTIKFQIDIGADSNIIKDNTGIKIDYSGNASYANINENKGLILSKANIQTGNAYSSTGRAESSLATKWFNNAVYGNVNKNDGLIMSDFYSQSGTAKSTLHKSTYSYKCSLTDVCIPVRLEDTANAVRGNVKENNGHILTDVDIRGGHADNNISGSYATADTKALNTGTAVFAGLDGRVNENRGVIHTSFKMTGASADASDHFGGSYYIEIQNTANAVFGYVKKNKGIISTNTSLKTIDKAVPTAVTHIQNIRSANGIYGGISENKGTIRSYLLRDAVDNNINYNHSGNGVTYINKHTPNTINEGSILASLSAVSLDRSEYKTGAFKNYGVMVGQEIYARTSSDGKTPIAVNLNGDENYGVHIKIDDDGNVKSITQGQRGEFNGKRIIQAALNRSGDSYDIYSGNAILVRNSIINGVGAASGVVTLKDINYDFRISNSILNAYYTALELKDTNKVTLTNSSINGGGLQGNIPVIKGDQQANKLFLISDTVINGDIKLKAGNDLIVVDHLNAQVNGKIDLGDGNKDVFAFYNFNGNGVEAEAIVESYIRNGDFYDILGSKVTNMEYIGFQKGFINVETKNYQDRGIYIGDEATFTFMNNRDYKIKSLINLGRISLVDGSSNDNLTILEDAYIAGVIEKDTNFDEGTTDNFTVLGELSGNAQIHINGVGSGVPQATEKTLIYTPNDKNNDNENFTFIPEQRYNGRTNKGRLDGSSYPWYLLKNQDKWVLSLSSEVTSDGGVTGDGFDGGNTGGGNTGSGNTGSGNTGSGNTGSGNTGNGNTGNGNTGNGNTGNGNTGSRPVEILAEIPAYASLPSLSYEIVMSDLGIMHNRLGELRNNTGWVGSGPSHLWSHLGDGWNNTIGFDDSRVNVWIKGNVNYFKFDKGSAFDTSGQYGGFMVGMDKKLDLPKSWTAFVGLLTSYKTGDFEAGGNGDDKYISTVVSMIKMTSLSAGAYGTFFHSSGAFIDIIGEYFMLDADINAAGLRASTDGYVAAGSIEAGYSLDIAKNWIIEPQVQLDIAYTHWNSLVDTYNEISFDDQVSFTTRVGARLEKTIKVKNKEIKPWIYGGIINEFSELKALHFSFEDFPILEHGFNGEIDAGITAQLNKNMQIYGNGGYITDLDSYNTVHGNIGLRLNW